MTIAPDGRVIVVPFQTGNGEIVAFDSTGTKSLWRLPIGWGDDKEVRGIQHMGFAGATLWLGDRGFSQVALVGGNGKVTKSLEYPAFVRPLLSERRKFPVFGSLDVLAVYADGTWLVRPYREHGFVETPEFDSASVHLFRVTAAGVIQRVIAKYPEDPVVEISEKPRTMRLGLYFGNRALFDVSPDGMRIAIVIASMSGKDSATFRVTTLNERGDTVFARNIPYVPERVSKTSRDSALRRLGNVGAWGVAAAKAEQEKRMPPFHMPVSSVMIGRDRTTWLTLRSAPSDSLNITRLVLDPRGEPIASVTAPITVNVLAVDKDHVWGIERQKGNLRTVVRYKLIPKR